MQAAEVEHEGVTRSDPEVVQTRDVALDEARRDVRGLHLLAGRLDRRRDEVDAGDVPAMLGHVEDVGSCAAAEVERAPRRPGVGSFDQLFELGRRDAGVPGLEAESVHRPKHEVREVAGHQRFGDAAGAGWPAVRDGTTANAIAIVTANAGLQARNPPKLIT